MPSMAAKKNVDEVWAALKRGAAPSNAARQTASGAGERGAEAVGAPKVGAAPAVKAAGGGGGADFDKLWFSFSNDMGGGGRCGVGAGLGPEYDLPVKRSGVPPPRAAAEAPAPAATPAAAGGKRAVAVGLTYEEVEVALQRDLQCLQDPSPGVRRKAIGKIQDALLEAPQPPEDVVVEVAEELVGKELLRRFDDASEATREAAVSLLKTLVQRYPDATLALLPYAIPVLQERLDRQEGALALAEPVEELRLHLLQLLHALIANGDKAILAYGTEVMEITRAGCADSFHKVLEETCACMQLFVGIAGQRLGKNGHQLVADVCPLVSHNRFRVRVAAVRTLKAIIPTGSHEMILQLVAHRDPNTVPIKAFYEGDTKVNFCARLATDRHAAVRAEFLDMLREWLLKLPERRDHEQRLLPYVVSLVNDEMTSISNRAMGVMEALGTQYEVDQKDDERVKEQRYYLPEEAHGLGWSQLEGQVPMYGDEKDSLDVSGGASVGRTRIPMPWPFKRRPGLGARVLVQANFNRVAKTVCEELSSWITENRPRTGALLRTMLVYQEDHAMTQLHRMLPAFQMVILADPELRPYVEQCCEIIGCFVHPEHYLPLLLPFFEDAIAVDHSKTAPTLAVLAHLVWGAGPKLAATGHLPAVMAVLSSDRISFSKDSAIRREALRLAEAIVGAGGAAMLDAAPDMLAVLLRGQSLSMLLQDADATSYDAGAFACMERLAELAGAGSSAALVAAHRAALLPSPTEGAASANLDQQLAVLSLVLEGGRYQREKAADTLITPPPLATPEPSAAMQGWGGSDTECVIACMRAAPAAASSSMQMELLTSVEQFARTVPPEAVSAEEVEAFVHAAIKLTQAAAQAPAAKNAAAGSFLCAVRWALVRCLGGEAARGAWMPGVLSLLEEFSRMEYSVAVRLGAVHTLQELLLLPASLQALPCPGSTAGHEATRTDAADAHFAVMSMVRHQPEWLAALLARLDDADSGLQAAAVRALTTLLAALAGQAAAAAPYESAGTPEVVVFSALRLANEASPGVQQALVGFAECAAETRPELLRAAVDGRQGELSCQPPLLTSLKALQIVGA